MKKQKHEGTEAEITCILETSAPDVFNLTSGKIDEKLYFMGKWYRGRYMGDREELMKIHARGMFHGSCEE